MKNIKYFSIIFQYSFIQKFLIRKNVVLNSPTPEKAPIKTDWLFQSN